MYKTKQKSTGRMMKAAIYKSIVNVIPKEGF